MKVEHLAGAVITGVHLVGAAPIQLPPIPEAISDASIKHLKNIKIATFKSSVVRHFCDDVRSGANSAIRRSLPTKHAKEAVQALVRDDGAQKVRTGRGSEASSSRAQFFKALRVLLRACAVEDALVKQFIYKTCFKQRFRSGMGIELSTNLLSGFLDDTTQNRLARIQLKDSNRAEMAEKLHLLNSIVGRIVATGIIKQEFSPTQIAAGTLTSAACERVLKWAGDHSEALFELLGDASQKYYGHNAIDIQHNSLAE